ncbi:hypothetical protein ABEF95_009547 [Exophiala dermatitidis]
MAPATDPTPNLDSAQVAKDATYLFEVFRESPQPITIHIGGYAAKTGAKPNTVIKRLSEIKKRNKLNLVTTTLTADEPKSNNKATPTKSNVVKKERTTPSKSAQMAQPGFNYTGSGFAQDCNTLPSPTDSTGNTTPRNTPLKRTAPMVTDEEAEHDSHIVAKKIKQEP